MALVTVDVELELDEFSDDEIKAEYEGRKLGWKVDHDEQLQRAYMLHHQGKKDDAYEILWAMCLDKLNKVV